jgi:hypothetical protein
VHIELMEALVTVIVILNIYIYRAQYFALCSELSRIVRHTHINGAQPPDSGGILEGWVL